MNILRRLGLITTTALAFMAAVTVAAPGVSWALCDDGRTWDPVARLCDPPPPMPVWYQVPPSYAQPWAPAWAPPPPPNPIPGLAIMPVWNPQTNDWSWTPQ
jgi:hypothetical protein